MAAVDAYQLSLQATGTYAAAQALLAKAQEYADIALTNGSTWWLPGDQQRQNLQLQIDQAQIELYSRGHVDEDWCPSWEGIRNLFWKAKSEAAAADEGAAQRVSNTVQLANDIKTNAAQVATGIGIGALGIGVLVGVVAFIFFVKGH